jgi:division protein CdvB (Snf7/Vps24/ESCRT-III family)
MWLSGDNKKKEEHTTSPLTKIKIFNKRLARQIGKMELQERKAKAKAIESRKKGDIVGSKMHMKSCLQYRKWSHSTENFRVRMEGVQFKLQQAKAMQQFAGVAQDIASTLQGLSSQVQMPEISKLIGQMDMGFAGFDAMMEGTTEQLQVSEDSSSTAVSDSEVDEALAEVDTEFALETNEILPSAPMSTGEAEPAIDDLEDEIRKLKEQRGIN